MYIWHLHHGRGMQHRKALKAQLCKPMCLMQLSLYNRMVGMPESTTHRTVFTASSLSQRHFTCCSKALFSFPLLYSCLNKHPRNVSCRAAPTFIFAWHSQVELVQGTRTLRRHKSHFSRAVSMFYKDMFSELFP